MDNDILSGEWVQITLVPEAVKVLASDDHSHDYVVGFMDQREFSVPLGDREFRISNRPRVKVQVLISWALQKRRFSTILPGKVKCC